MNRQLYIIAGTSLLLLASCSQKKWSVEGKIEGAEGKELILEGANELGGWYGIDTLTVENDGTYAFHGLPAGHPEIYRLRLGSESAYFPIDSLETVTLNGSLANFATTYTLAGSPEADAMQSVNQMVDSIQRHAGAAAIASDEGIKRRIAEIILRNPSGMTAYYTIFRTIGGTQMFDPAVPFDNRVIGAVANAFNQTRPADPRTRMLSELFLAHRRKASAAPGDTIVATEIKHPEISLSDVNGKVRVLSDETARGNVVILNFTAYSAPESPAINVELAKVYDTNKGRGLQIYQVGFDSDEYLWRQSAKNIPWIAVYNPADASVKTLVDFNVGALPATFIINRNGDLVERVTDMSKLSSAVARYL